MAYPAQPSPFIRSGWVASQLIPNPDYHASALTFLGGQAPASNPRVSGVPQISGSSLQTPPSALFSQPAPQPQTSNFPDWMTSLLSQMGFSGNLPTSAANQPNFLPKGTPALRQEASQSPPNVNPYGTPMFGSTAKKKKDRGLFGTILDLSPGSPTIFGIGG